MDIEGLHTVFIAPGHINENYVKEYSVSMAAWNHLSYLIKFYWKHSLLRMWCMCPTPFLINTLHSETDVQNSRHLWCIFRNDNLEFGMTYCRDIFSREMQKQIHLFLYHGQKLHPEEMSTDIEDIKKLDHNEFRPNADPKRKPVRRDNVGHFRISHLHNIYGISAGLRYSWEGNCSDREHYY